MNQPVLNEIVRLPTQPYDHGVELAAVRQGFAVEAGAEQEREGVVVGQEAGGKHLVIKAEGVGGTPPLDVGSDHGVPEERGAAGEAAEDEARVVEVAAVGDGAEGDELAGDVRVGDGAGDEEVGVDSLGFAHGEAGVAEEGEGSEVGLEVFDQRRYHLPLVAVGERDLFIHIFPIQRQIFKVFFFNVRIYFIYTLYIYIILFFTRWRERFIYLFILYYIFLIS